MEKASLLNIEYSQLNNYDGQIWQSQFIESIYSEPIYKN